LETNNDDKQTMMSSSEKENNKDDDSSSVVLLKPATVVVGVNVMETPTTNRFSFSKLTKFVSRSALKVMNRKLSTGSANDSSCSTDASFTSSSSCSNVSSSAPVTPSTTTATTTDDDEERTRVIKRSNQQQQVQQQPVYCEIEPESSTTTTTSLIYKSIQQRREIEDKLAQTCTLASSVMHRAQMKQPAMGVSSVILAKMRKNAPGGYGLTTGLFTSSVCLIGAPVVFQTSAKQHQQQQQQLPQPQSPAETNYDKLTRAPFLGEEMQQQQQRAPNRAPRKPIVKSLSSIVSAYSTPCKVQSFNKIAPTTTTTSPSTVALASQQQKNCRISIFSAKKLNNYNSTGRLDQQINYESFSEAVF
jgi:hypothetical protein